MNLPVGLRGRLVALGLLLTPLILVIHFGVRPLASAYLEVNDDIVNLREDISRYQGIIGELPDLQTAMNRLRRIQPLAPYLLAGVNPTLAAARLQRHLQEVAKQHGASIVRVRVQSTAADSPLDSVLVLARLQTDTRGLRDTLHALETGKPYVFVDRLNITSRQQRRRTKPTGRLDVQMTLSGLRAVGDEEARDG